jgi:hypothetical protein
MKRALFFSTVFFVFLAREGAAGADLGFSWSLGELETYYRSAAGFFDGRLSLGWFNLRINRKFDLGTQLFSAGSVGDGGKISYAFLPLKAEYRLFNPGGIFYVGLYGKAAWQFTQNGEDFNPFAPAPENGFYGGAGLEFILPLPLFARYEGAIALFIEYTVPEGFKAGFRADLLSLGALFFGD